MPDGVVLQISDTGDGIPADVLDRFFSLLFHQAERSGLV